MRLSDDATGRLDAPAVPGRPVLQRLAVGAAAGTIVLGALLLRLHEIGAQELWLDEAYSHYFLGRGLSVLAEGSTPPLYFFLLRAFTAVAGTTETALRLPSALAGTLFVATVIWVGRDIVDTAAGLWSGAVAATAPLHIYYSQEARPYALLTLTLILTYGALWRAVQTNAWTWWAAASLGATLSLYTHYFALLGLVPTASLVLARAGRISWKGYVAALGTSAVLLVPWILWSASFPVRRFAGGSETALAWQNTPPAWAIPRSLEVFALGSQAGLIPLKLKQFTDLAFPEGLRLLGLTMLWALAIWLVGPWGDRATGAPRLGRTKIWLGLQLFFPLTALWVLSFLRPVYLVGRYDLVAFPPVPLLLGFALYKLHRCRPAGPILAVLAATLLLFPVGAKLARYYRAPAPQHFRPVAKMLDAVVAQGDAVVFAGPSGRVVPWTALLVTYYLEQIGYRWENGYCEAPAPPRRFPCRTYPLERERHPATRPYDRVLTAPESVRDDAHRYVHMLAPGTGRLFVVFWHIHRSADRVEVPHTDLLLVQALTQEGMQALPLADNDRVVMFRRS